jgi:hypothetical protein
MSSQRLYLHSMVGKKGCDSMGKIAQYLTSLLFIEWLVHSSGLIFVKSGGMFSWLLELLLVHL